MAKVKNDNLSNVMNALGALMQIKLPPRAFLKVRNIHRAVMLRHEDVDFVRKGLVDTYAQRGEDGEMVAGEPYNGQPTIKIREADDEAFKAAIKELYETEFDVETVLTEKDFGDVMIEPLAIIQLGSLVE